MSHGTTFNLLWHLLDVEWSWRMFATGGSGQQFLWAVEDLPDVAAIRRFWQDERVKMLDFVNQLNDADLEREIDYGTVQGGEPQYAELWQILVHIVNRGTQHQGEPSRQEVGKCAANRPILTVPVQPLFSSR